MSEPKGESNGWEAGIRTPLYRSYQLTDGARVVVTTRSVLATSGYPPSPQESPPILANPPDSWRHCGDVMRALHGHVARDMRERPVRVMITLCSPASRLSLRSTLSGLRP